MSDAGSMNSRRSCWRVHKYPFHVEEVRAAYERRSITYGELAECLRALENAPNVAAADAITAARRRMCE